MSREADQGNLLEHRIKRLAGNLPQAEMILRNIQLDALMTIEALGLSAMDVTCLFDKIARCDYARMVLVLRCFRFGVLRKETITSAIRECFEAPEYQPVTLRFSNKVFGQLALKLFGRENNEGRRLHCAPGSKDTPKRAP